jgi:hypothetical protein
MHVNEAASALRSAALRCAATPPPSRSAPWRCAHPRAVRPGGPRSYRDAQNISDPIWVVADTQSTRAPVEPSACCSRRHATRREQAGQPRCRQLPGLASLLFAVALVRADSPFLLTAILPVVPAVLAPVRPIGLGEGERAVSWCLVHHLDSFCHLYSFCVRRDGHANDQAKNDDE